MTTLRSLLKEKSSKFNSTENLLRVTRYFCTEQWLLVNWDGSTFSEIEQGQVVMGSAGNTCSVTEGKSSHKKKSKEEENYLLTLQKSVFTTSHLAI